jgi:hypothetical protein
MNSDKPIKTEEEIQAFIDALEIRRQEETQALKDALKRFCEFEAETNHKGIFQVESIFLFVCEAALKGGFTTEDLFNSLVAAIGHNSTHGYDTITYRVYDALQKYAEETRKSKGQDQ